MHPNRIFLHQNPNLIKNGGVHTAPEGEDFPFHRDQFWELMYLRTGHIICQQEGERYPLHPGMAILHPPSALHADFATTAYTTYYIWIDAAADAPWPRLCYDDEQQDLERLCRTIVQEWRGKHPDREQMLSLLAGQMGVLLRRTASETEPSSGEVIVASAEQIMEATYRETLTVGEIARQVGASVSSLHAHFAHLRGQTPMESLQAIRLRHALAQLHHSTLTLDVIAGLCGYHSASHLSRHVKAATGESPGSLRHQHR